MISTCCGNSSWNDLSFSFIFFIVFRVLFSFLLFYCLFSLSFFSSSSLVSFVLIFFGIGYLFISSIESVSFAVCIHLEAFPISTLLLSFALFQDFADFFYFWPIVVAAALGYFCLLVLPCHVSFRVCHFLPWFWQNRNCMFGLAYYRSFHFFKSSFELCPPHSLAHQNC